jgi:hypothetical protein
MRRLRGKLTYANVVSTLCLFLLLGGGAAFAAIQLPKNSVGTKQLKKNSVIGSKVKDGSLTGADINLSMLGTVPSATNATHATRADRATRADNAGLLQGHHASDFLGAGATAANSKQLGGLGASSFLGAPVVVRTKTFGGFQTGSGRATLATSCDNGETAVSGGFREAGSNAGEPGLGFDGTFQLLASGPAVQGEESPMPAHAGETPIGWYIELDYSANGSNPEVVVYVDCVPSR